MEKKDNKSFWKGLGDYLLALFKTQAVKALMKAIFGASVRLAGFKLWLVSLAVEVFWDHVGAPIAKLAIRKSLLVYDKTNGHIQVKKLRKAKEAKDEKSHKSAVDSILK